MTPQVRPVGRFEWEQILRRMRCTGLIGGSGKLGKNGRPTKGGISAAHFKAVALILATYGELNGTEIYPGDAAVAVDTETSVKTVRAVRGKLSELGMLQHVRAPRNRRGEEWRLTLPLELPATVEVLTPAQHKIAATRLRNGARGNLGGSDGPPAVPVSPDVTGGPTDHPRPVDNSVTGGPLDHPDECGSEKSGGSIGPTENGFGGSNGPFPGGPLDPRTKPLPSHKEHQANSGEDLGTASHPSRAPEAAEDPDSADEVDRPYDRRALLAQIASARDKVRAKASPKINPIAEAIGHRAARMFGPPDPATA